MRLQPTPPSPSTQHPLVNKLALALSSLAVLVALYAASRPTAPAEGAAPPVEEAGELAYHMAYLQRYADKLHAAGAAANWELASFYLPEIEETAEAIVEEGHEEEGIALSPLVEAMLLPAVERVEANVGDPSAFGAAYADLVASCNACHEASAHGFIRIITPERSAYPNQAFAPAPTAGNR